MTPITVLGFDYGTRHLGVAVGQTLTGGANPIATLSVRGARPDWARVDALVAEWRPARLVVGVPLNMDGSEQALTHLARGFMAALAQRYDLEVSAADERLSTREARARLAEHGRKPNTDDHAVAAQIILEGWLSERGVAA